MLRSAVMKLVPRRIVRLAKDERGVSAVEFAMLLPLMVTLYLGGVEVSQGISIDRKVTLASRTVADLTSQVSSITAAGVTDLLKASAAILAPYPSDKAKITVTSLKIDANSKVTVDWSQSQGGSAHAKGSTPTIPTALIVPNTSLIWGEVSYEYKPVVGYVLTGTLTLKDQIFMRPRLSESVVLSPS
jgi:Flp pilus assembly protein TadG